MKAIETRYKGFRFRSRLEARYAVFFDALDEKWQYEPEGYDLEDGDLYLPDLYLPRIHTFVEIKGAEPNEIEIRKCRKLQFHTESDVVICSGLPMENEALHFGWDNSEGGHFTETKVQWTINDGHLELTDYEGDRPQVLVKAEIAAKSARFEHGETPSREYRNIVDYKNIAF